MGRPPKAATPEVEAEDVYELEDIVDYRSDNGKDVFLVKWKGFGQEDNTWEPADNILVPGPNISRRMKELKQAYGKPAKEQISATRAVSRPSRSPEAPRSGKRKPSREPSAAGPEGKVRVHHIGRGRIRGDTELMATLRWDNGYEEVEQVQKLRKRYPMELLDYLLSRVRFRNDGGRCE